MTPTVPHTRPLARLARLALDVFAIVVFMAAVLAGALLLFVGLSGAAHAQIGTGAADLTWTPPDAFEDGTPLAVDDLAGYVIFYGTESRAGGRCDGGPPDPRPRPAARDDTSCYPAAIPIGNGAVQSRQVDLSLTESVTLWFAVAAEATNGLLSVYSNEASKLIELVIDAIAPGEPVNVTLEISLECEPGEPGRTCSFIIQ